MMELSLEVRAALLRDDVEGIVITHGTDTLEETAYLLDLTVQNSKPVVLVGAMRNSSEMGWDGPSNLISAIRVAASDAPAELGVVVVMNDTILAAAEATKTHTEAFDAFESPNFGPLGLVDKGEVIITRGRSDRTHIETREVAEPVFLIKAAAGMDSILIDACLESGAKGLVIEGLGRGNLPPAAAVGVGRAIGTGIPVVLVSRCQRGRVYPSYGYEGGGKHLSDIGVIRSSFLNGQKARIKLAVALGSTARLPLNELFS
jgi:L-asparaginase